MIIDYLNMRKILLGLSIIVILLGAAIGLGAILKDRESPPVQQGVLDLPQELQNEKIVLNDYVRYLGRDGATAFDLLKEAARVEYKEYDFGVFVESINGVKPDDQHFWKLYYNGTESQVGASELQTKDGDVIEWKLEQMELN